jgi:hypothetical protein
MLIVNLSALAEGTLKRYCITIGKTVTIHPNAGEVFFYLRILLNHNHTAGTTSFEDLKIENVKMCSTLKKPFVN